MQLLVDTHATSHSFIIIISYFLLEFYFDFYFLSATGLTKEGVLKSLMSMPNKRMFQLFLVDLAKVKAA